MQFIIIMIDDIQYCIKDTSTVRLKMIIVLFMILMKQLVICFTPVQSDRNDRPEMTGTSRLDFIHRAAFSYRDKVRKCHDLSILKGKHIPVLPPSPFTSVIPTRPYKAHLLFPMAFQCLHTELHIELRFID